MRKEIKQIEERFLKQKESNPEILKKNNKKEINNLFSIILDQFNQLPPSYISVTLASNSLFFKIPSINGYEVYYEVFYRESSDGMQVIFSIYQGNNLISRDMGNIEDMFSLLLNKLNI